MCREWFLLVIIQVCFLGYWCSPDSCYYCTGTPQCGDPMDYREVYPHECSENSVCLKYISSSKNMFGHMVAHDLTYRQCFDAVLFEEDICTFVKKNEEDDLRQFNQTLAKFECYVCKDTNCNQAQSIKGFYLAWIGLTFILFVNLPF